MVPNTEFGKVKNFYVVLLKTDKRDIASQIAEVLNEKGYIATEEATKLNIEEGLTLLSTLDI